MCKQKHSKHVVFPQTGDDDARCGGMTQIPGGEMVWTWRWGTGSWVEFMALSYRALWLWQTKGDNRGNFPHTDIDVVMESSPPKTQILLSIKTKIKYKSVDSRTRENEPRYNIIYNNFEETPNHTMTCNPTMTSSQQRLLYLPIIPFQL